MSLATQSFDSSLGRWTLHEWKDPRLAAWIDLVWLSDGIAAFPRKRMLPNGRLELIVNLGPPIRLAEGRGIAVFRGGSISGVQTVPLVIEMSQRHRVLGVRLRPAGARALLARPIDGVSDWTVDLPDVLGSAGHELAERCAGALSPEACLRHALAWIWARIAPRREADPALALAAARIEASGGSVSISALRERMGVPRARFAAAFRAEMGVSPKRYARIFRFRRALARLHESDDDLDEIALATGYYDQAHMSADFRALAGMAPGAVRAAPCYAGTLAVADRTAGRDPRLSSKTRGPAAA